MLKKWQADNWFGAHCGLHPVTEPVQGYFSRAWEEKIQKEMEEKKAMARTAGYSRCPMAGKKLGTRTSWLAGWRRRKRAKENPMVVTWYNRPVVPAGFRGRCE